MRRNAPELSPLIDALGGKSGLLSVCKGLCFKIGDLVAGFIYILSNKSMPGVLKIGRTDRLPDVRARELWTTGVPTSFTVEFAVYAADPISSEFEIHEELADSRVERQREFFHLAVDDATKSVLRIILGPDLEVAHPSQVLNEDCLAFYSHVCGCPSELVRAVIDNIEQSAWMASLSAIEGKHNCAGGASDGR